jgi:hypothetical protein
LGIGSLENFPKELAKLVELALEKHKKIPRNNKICKNINTNYNATYLIYFQLLDSP